MNNSPRERYVSIDPIILKEMGKILKIFKKRKASGSDKLNMALFKHSSTTDKLRFLNILNICWTTYQIPDDWEKATIIPILIKVTG
jgi:hypothetical protein